MTIPTTPAVAIGAAVMATGRVAAAVGRTAVSVFGIIVIGALDVAEAIRDDWSNA